MFEDTRSRLLSQHPLLSPRRGKNVAHALSDQRFQALFNDSVRSTSRPELFAAYIKSAVIHSLALRLKESFIQVGRADENQVVMHVQLPIQFSAVDDPTITVCEAGAFGDGTTRTFIAHFGEGAQHWCDGFIEGCPNAREDSAMRKLFVHVSRHEAWRNLDPNDPVALASLADPLGLTERDAIPVALLRVLFGSETVGVESFELYDLACAVRTVDRLSMIAETGPQIFTEEGPPSKTRTDGSARPGESGRGVQPGRARVGAGRIFGEFRRGS